MGKGHMHIVSGGGHRSSNVHHNLAQLKRNAAPQPLDQPGGFISPELQEELNQESERKFGSDVKKPSSNDAKKPTSSSSHDDLRKRAEDDPIPEECLKGGFITGPARGSSIDVLSGPVPITWLPTCLPTHKFIDIYLYAPGLPHPRLQRFSNVPNTGSASLEFKPRWWDAKKDQSLQVQVVGHDTETFLSQFPMGPLFTAKWEDPKEGVVVEALDTAKINVGETVVMGASTGSSSLSRGKTAVAVLIPLLILGLGGFAFFKWKRKRESEKRKDWAEQVDKRMSTISTDWKSVTVAGAQAGIRSSMAASRASMAMGPGGTRGSFAFGNLRPQSNFDDMDEKAGVLGSDQTFDKAQRRPGVGLRNPSGLGDRAASSVYTNRTSRVSFADQTRPSMDRRTKTFNDSHAPPVPSLPGTGRRPSIESNSSDDISNAYSTPNNGSMSPTQTTGPVTLTPEDIRARIAAGRARSDSRAASEGRARSGSEVGGREGARSKMAERGMSEVDGDVLPALAMMRANADNDDYLLSQPTPPAATYPKPMTSITPHTSGDGSVPLSPNSRSMTMSPVMHTLPMQALPASVMSPDDMLRAYAERKKSGIVAYPQAPAPSVVAPGGRTLFNGMVSPTHTGETPVPKIPQMGFGVGEYDSNFSFGQQTPASFEAPVMPAAAGLEAPPSPLGKRKSASNNPYMAHAQQSYQSNDTAYAYDANYAAGPYAIGEADDEENRAGRGAYRG